MGVAAAFLARADRTASPCLPPRPQLELKECLTKVYNLPVASLRTSVLAGKKKRGKHGHYARADVKKAYVSLKPPAGNSS